MTTIKIKDLKLGQYFTLKPIEYPTVQQVYVRDSYNRSTKKYEAYKFADVCSFREFKADKEVYIDFIF